MGNNRMPEKYRCDPDDLNLEDIVYVECDTIYGFKYLTYEVDRITPKRTKFTFTRDHVKSTEVCLKAHSRWDVFAISEETSKIAEGLNKEYLRRKRVGVSFGNLEKIIKGIRLDCWEAISDGKNVDEIFSHSDAALKEVYAIMNILKGEKDDKKTVDVG